VFRRYLSAAFGVGISFFAAPATAGPDEIVDALLRCRPDFFEVLKTEKSAFAPALIRHREIPVSDIVTSLANIATFQESIASRGVDIQVYLQTVISGSGDADRRTHIWGVLVPGEPQEVIDTLEANVPGAKFEPSADGWMLKGDQWQRPDPWSLLLVRRYQDNFGAGSSIWCFAETAVLDPMQVLPDIEELLWKF
jgi:hypothetical protein